MYVYSVDGRDSVKKQLPLLVELSVHIT